MIAGIGELASEFRQERDAFASLPRGRDFDPNAFLLARTFYHVICVTQRFENLREQVIGSRNISGLLCFCEGCGNVVVLVALKRHATDSVLRHQLLQVFGCDYLPINCVSVFVLAY